MELLTVMNLIGTGLTIEEGLRSILKDSLKMISENHSEKNYRSLSELVDYDKLPSDMEYYFSQADDYISKTHYAVSEQLFTEHERQGFIDSFYKTHLDCLPYRTDVDAILNAYLDELEEALKSGMTFKDIFINRRLSKIQDIAQQNLDITQQGFGLVQDSNNRIIEIQKAVVSNPPQIPRCLTPIPAINRHVGLIGRDEIIVEVRSKLDKDSRAAIVSGIGGIGKTALMQWVCNQIIEEEEEGNYVAWIDCGVSIEEDFLLLGEAFGIDVKDPAAAFRTIVHAIKTRLNGKLYLFLDNLTRTTRKEELNTLNSLGAHIMVTSRTINPAFPIVELDVLDEDPAVTMFYKYYNDDKDRTQEDAAKHIVRTVNRHTLLVELLAKAARKSGGSLENFDRQLEEKGFFDVFKRRITTQHDENQTIEESIMKLYEISVLSPEQKHIMRLFSIFTPEKEIYYKLGEWAGLDLDALDELVDLAWIGRGGWENGYHIHQIIKDSIARQMESKKDELDLGEYGELIDRVTDTDSYLSGDVDYVTVRERLMLPEDVKEYLSYRVGLKGKLFDERYKETIGDNNDTKNLIPIANLYNEIGLVYYKQGDYEKALEYYRKALVIKEKQLGNNHPSTSITYNNIGLVYKKQGDYKKALEYYRKALAIREKVLGKEHPDTATTYNNIGGVYYKQGDYEKMMEYYKKSLAIREKVLVKEHPDMATTYNNIGLVYNKQGNYEKALEYFSKALAIKEKVLGEEHPSTATTHSNIGEVYRKQGDYEEALNHHRKALAIREKVLGKEHPSTATTYNNTGLVYRDQGDYEKALEYYEKALAIRIIKLGEDHPLTLKVQQSIWIMTRYLKMEIDEGVE